MDSEYKAKTVIYVDPIRVEDRPLPVHIRTWESVRRFTRTACMNLSRHHGLKKALWAAAALLALAAGPLWLILLLMGAGRSTRRAAGFGC